MIFSIFPNFGALNSQPVFEAFKKGAEKLGHTVCIHDMNADVFVIWSVLWHGRMRNNQEIWNFAKIHKKQILILEVGGLIRGSTWKVGLNHINRNGYFGNDQNLDLERSKKLGIFLKPWKNSGKNILICGQHTKSQQWDNLPSPEQWLSNLVETIKKVSNRKIVFRPHPRDFGWCQKMVKSDIELKIPQKIAGTESNFDHQSDFNNAWCVINLSSTPAILAAIEGIPIFTSPDSLAYPVSMKNIEKIEDPVMPDRQLWLEQICHTEWSLSEIESGIPIKRIFK